MTQNNRQNLILFLILAAGPIIGCAPEGPERMSRGEAVRYFAAQTTSLRSQAERIVRIGVGLEQQNTVQFLQALQNANVGLAGCGIYVECLEVLAIEQPASFGLSDFEYGIVHSFSQPCDYYFVWTQTDYSSKEGDYHARSFVSRKICLIDADFEAAKLDVLIEQEIKRLFTGAEDAIVYSMKDAYWQPIECAVETESSEKVFRRRPYNIITNTDREREVTVNIILDSVSQDFAKQVMDGVSDVFRQEFGITFRVVDSREFTLPDSWETYELMPRFAAEAEQPSDLYLLFTSRDWANDDDFQFRSVTGEVYPDYGWCYIETCYEAETIVNTLVHEMAHLFGARHVFRIDAIMHPYKTNTGFWAPKTREIILQNKFRTWKTAR